MPKYYFVIRRPDCDEADPYGTDCRQDSAAFEYAELIVKELKAGGGYDDPGLMMVVQNAARETVFTIPFQVASVGWRWKRVEAVPATAA